MGNIGTVLTRNELIKQAYKKTGILAEGESLTAEQIQDGQNILTAIVYEHINKGLKIWKRDFATLFLEGGKTKYDIGSTARCTSSYIKSSVDGDYEEGKYTIKVESSEGMCEGDNIGIMSSNDLYWYKVSFATDNQITLSEPLEVDITDGSAVFVYTYTIQNPLSIDKAMIRYQLTATDNRMLRYSRDEYFDLANKSSEGIPYNFYSARKEELTEFFVYTTPQDSQHTIEIDYTIPLFLTDSPADIVDFTRAYMQLLIYAVANELCVENGIGGETAMTIGNNKLKLFDEATAYDSEETSIFLSPNTNE